MNVLGPAELSRREIAGGSSGFVSKAVPYRRFGQALTDQPARLGVDAVRYSFIVVDFHHLLPAGRPALLTLPTTTSAWSTTC